MINEAVLDDGQLTEPLLPQSSNDEHDQVATATTTTSAVTIRPKSLAWAPTTPLLAKLLLPLLILSTHGLFYYGQTANMWRLTGSYDYNLNYKATSSETKIAMGVLNIPTSDTFTDSKIKNVRTFTYMYAIQELWRAKGMPGLFLPRLAAVGLLVFSGVWPHLKLFMLLMTWYFVKQPERRRRALTSLSVLGKWSLVDVLVVCVMVGVLNLEFIFTAQHLLDSVITHAPELLDLLHSLYSTEDLCTKALHYSCHNPSILKHMIECKACTKTVSEIINHPSTARSMLSGLTVSGGGQGQLAVAGLKGIYSFCGAVILSILLSLLVDWYDEKSRKAVNVNEEHATAPEISGTLEDVVERGDARSQADREFDRRVYVQSQQRSNLVWQILGWATFCIVVLATSSISMERRVNGALPTLGHDILGVLWTKQYSFWQLGWTTGKAGGWDWMLMGTFVWFIIVGPLMRSVLVVRASRQTEQPDMTTSRIALVRQRRERLSLSINFVGAFCAWEVFAVAVLMVDLLMPSITNTIIMDKRCAALTKNSTSECLEVEFDMTKTFALVITGGLLLWIVSYRARSYRGFD